MNWTLINISQGLKYDDKAYNAFPAEIESHIAGLEGADVAEFVGIKHDVFDEEIFTLVRP